MNNAKLLLTDYDAEGRPVAADMATHAAPLSVVLTDELEGAAIALGVTGDDLLVAALGRAIQRTIGDGTASVDIARYGTRVAVLALPCAPPEHLSATDMLAGVHESMSSVPDDTRTQPMSEVLFSSDPVEARAHLGHVLELHAFRGADVVNLEWSYDVRSFEAYTITELAEQFPLALVELTSEAAPPIMATAQLALAH